MSRARILADYVSSGDELADKAPLASPAFTGTPTGITAAHLEAGVLPSDVTGGSGLTLGGAVGMIAPFAMASPPTGWLACDGSAVSRTVTYSALFAALSTTWGVGDGSTTFNVPDLEGAFLRGTGSHGTSTMAAGSAFAGPSVGAYQNDGLQAHGHTIKVHTTGATGGISIGYGSAPVNVAGQVFGLETTGASTPRGEQETRSFNAGVKYCIKY